LWPSSYGGGFRTTDGSDKCKASHTGSNGQPQADYIPHHEPFQFYVSTLDRDEARLARLGTMTRRADQQ
jgi:hypothetical protein